VTAESNLVQQGQERDPLSVSKKARKGDTGGAEELMPFARVMEDAQSTMPQEEGECSLETPPGKGEIKGSSDKGNAIKRGEKHVGGSENVPGTGKGKAEKADQSLPVKDNDLAGSSHKIARKGEAAKEIKLSINMPEGDEGAKGLKVPVHTSEGGEAVKDSNPFMGILKGTGTKVDTLSRDAITVLPEKGGKGQIAAGEDALPKNDFPKGGKAEMVRSLTGAEPKSLNPRLQKAGVQTGTPESRTAEITVGKDGALKETGKTRVAAPEGTQVRSEKGLAVAFKNNGINEAEIAENLRVIQRAPGALKAGLKKAAAVQGKIAVFQNEEDGTGKNSRVVQGTSGAVQSGLKKAAAVKKKGSAERTSYTPATGGSKNDIGKQLGLKDETAPVGYKEMVGKKTHDHTAGVPRRETLQSASPAAERDVPVGGYQQTVLHAGGRSVAPPGNVGITPRALIDQVAGGAKMSGRVRIALNPPNLGTLDMDVLVRGNNKVHVILQVENSDVKQMLQSHVESLKGSLRSQGLVADSIQVFAQEKADSDTYG